MGGINDYLSGIKKQYPDTQEVREQVEELRDTLHLKTEEYQAMGRTYNEAVREAISSMGDLTPLLDQVSGNTRSVYTSRLNWHNARYGTLMVAAEYLLGWLVYLLSSYQSGTSYIPAVIIIGLFLGGALGIWLLITHIIYKRQPDCVRTVGMAYKKLIRIALIVWGAISLVLFVYNVSLLIYNNGLWSIWFVLFIANWPLGIWLYHRLLVSGRYDAE
jgi:hypothetical protein